MLTLHVAVVAAADAQSREGWRVAWAFCLAVGVVLSLMTWFLSKNVNRPGVSFKKDPIGNTNRRMLPWSVAASVACLLLALGLAIASLVVPR